MNPERSSSGQTPSRLIDEDVTRHIIGGAFEVHKELGSGFNEAVYVRSLAVALQLRGVHVEREYPITVVFRGVEVGSHRLDLLVEGRVVVEVKTMEKIPVAAKAQVRRYLIAARKEVGLLINFGPTVQFCRILNSRLRRDSP